MIKGAVLGSPISHSLSPLLHKIAYDHIGVDASYEAIEVRSGELANFLAGTHLNSLSLTMPLKEEALLLASSITQISHQISSGNTLYLRGGDWSLTSTDVDGFTHSLKDHSISKVDRCLIIGAGATARAAVAAISPIASEVLVINRNLERVDAMNRAGNRKEIQYLPWSLTDEINTCDLVVNTTPGDVAHYFLPSIDNPRGVFFEVLYNPWPTSVMKIWSNFQAPIIDGIDLLVHQAVSQVEIFSEQRVDRPFLHSKLRLAALNHLEQSTP